MLAEDRKKHGMFSILSVANNITSAGLKLLRGRMGLKIGEEREVSEEFVGKLNIRTPSV